MRKVISQYKKLIFFFTLINLFALATVPLGMNGRLSGSMYNITLFNNSHSDDQGSEFWPLVKFVEHVDTFKYYGTHENDYTAFNGIFYGYGIEEFVLYMSILIVFLLYRGLISKDEVMVPHSVRVKK